MDKDTRNAIERATQRARRLLEEDFAAQLEGDFDVARSGEVAAEAGAHLDPRRRVARERIVAAIEHECAAGASAADSVAAYLRNAAFTTLNRFVALKMLEARALVQECISRGEQSSGYRVEFCGMAPGLPLLPEGSGYRLYIESLFDELSTEVKVLFDRRDPASVLWPRRTTFELLLALLDAPELAAVWGEDETIGWVYQYFNREEDRRAARYDENGKPKAPRNSRELAVRNQFFTPRYVVEFLTDNTLGRMWWEMRSGETVLAERCRYMVRKRDEILLSDPEGDADHALVGPDHPLPAWVTAVRAGDFDALPDPLGWEDCWLLGHLIQGYAIGEVRGLEAVTRFADERWAQAERTGAWDGSAAELWRCLFHRMRCYRWWCSPPPEGDEGVVFGSLCRALRERLLAERPTLVAYRAGKDPRDLRLLDPACGSGHFLLYAFDLLLTIYEEAWTDDNAASTATGRSLRADYSELADLRRALPGLILAHNLYGVDIDPRCAQIAQLALWMRAQRAYHDFAIRPADRPSIRRTNIVVAEPLVAGDALVTVFVARLGDPNLARFFSRLVDTLALAGELGVLLRLEDVLPGTPRQGQTADLFAPPAEQLRRALTDFAADAGTGGSIRRRLFIDDAAHGLGLLEIVETMYDVVLMNPPFGPGSTRAKAVFEKAYPRSKNDVYAAFVERAVELLVPRGRIGAITSRTGFFLSSFQKWREEILLAQAPPVVFADLGAGVLDSAMVETAAYCLEASA